MADKHYAIPDAPEIDLAIRKIRNDDPVNAEEILNPLVEKLVENLAALKKLADGKQAQLTGAAGQVLGFDAEGNPVAQAAPDASVNLLAITFVEDFLNQKFTVSAGQEVYSGVVNSVASPTICAVRQSNTKYKVACNTSGSNTVTQTVTTGSGFGLPTSVTFIRCDLIIEITNGPADEIGYLVQVYDEQGGDILTAISTSLTSYIVSVYKPGIWLINVTPHSGGKPLTNYVRVLPSDTVKNITINIS